MDRKLMLKLPQDIIEKAKRYAKAHQTSLFKLKESYLQKITNENSEKEKVTPLVKSLTGILELPDDYDHKKEYGGFLSKKYKWKENNSGFDRK